MSATLSGRGDKVVVPALPNPLRYLLLPLSVLRLFSGYKSFRDPYLGSAALNRRGPHIWRVRAAHAIAERRRRRLAHLVSDDDRAAFQAKGYVEKRNFLPPARYAALLSELRSLQAPAREMIQGGRLRDASPSLPNFSHKCLHSGKSLPLPNGPG